MATLGPPDPSLVSDKERFQQWLFQLWKYVVSGNAEVMQVILASRTFDGELAPVSFNEDTQKIMALSTFLKQPLPVSFREDAADILASQLFARQVIPLATEVNWADANNILANQVFGG